MQGDHDELEIFIEIRLIHFTNRSKIEEQEEEHRFLKRILAKKSSPIDAVVGADWRRHESDSLGIDRGSRIGAECATISLQKSHDRATITSRSGHDRALIVILILNRSPSDSVEGLWH